MTIPGGFLVPDSVQLVVPLTLIGPATAIDLTSAIVGDPSLERTIDGATTMTLDVLDYDRTLTNAGVFTQRSFAVADGMRFEVSNVHRTGDVVQLTFTDAIVAALSRRTAPKVFNAGTVSRADIAQFLGAEAGVAVVVDPAYRDTIGDAVTRNSDQDGTAAKGKNATKENSWSVLSNLAGARDGRCFSDGRQVLLGGDDWLLSRSAPLPIAEFTGGVDTIDFEVDIFQDSATGTVTVDADRWSLPPGLPVKVTDPGPHTGTWLLTRFERPLHATSGTLTLQRARPSLLEPEPSDAGAGESGELDFLADPFGPDIPVQSLRAAERAAGPLGRFLDFALQQKGKRYVWGASGPNSFDCSGLVQQAAAAAGYRFPKPCSSQLRLCQQGAARMLSVQDALRTRGALLFRVGMAGQGDHVAISLGDSNTTIEARGAAYGCGIFTNSARRQWNAGALLTFTGRSTISASGPR